LNMIPDVTPNGVFYLPPTGWLTSFYNPPDIINCCISGNYVVKFFRLVSAPLSLSYDESNNHGILYSMVTNLYDDLSSYF
ncbi:hypothetical protein FOL80_08140, partial [Lactobacillus reuteri]|nr:hypothetical protein [Limosilactobacillus reuteri]NMV62210.1 hypothetical protein [Limosilactobacillus reuteri]NMV63928.1 hypothetical protein [Limosilactobacillus reuteri]NMV67517.1 hypothetical protein [Limosilactobacillus reuteri]